jgi:hypothetical protein
MREEHGKAAAINVHRISRKRYAPSRRTSGGRGAGSLRPLALRGLARTVHLACRVAMPPETPVEIAEVSTATGAQLAGETTIATATRGRWKV